MSLKFVHIPTLFHLIHRVPYEERLHHAELCRSSSET